MPFFRDMIGHGQAIDILQSLIKKDQIPNALLFKGSEGIGKKTVAALFSQTLFCRNRTVPEIDPEGWIEPCGSCTACKKLIDKNHPDLLIIEPEGSAIKIDQIRQMQERIIFKPIESDKKVVLIDSADKMNAAAANSLLKTLEEPPAHALLILVTAHPFSLPQTLLSRCQQISFYPLSLSQIESILMEKKGWDASEARLVSCLTGGKLGEALFFDVETAREIEAGLHKLVSDETLSDYETLFEVATTFSRDETVMEKCLYYFSAWFRDVLVVQSVPNPAQLDPSWLVLSWREEEIKKWAGRFNTHETGKFLADIQEIEQAQVRNINRQLALETLLMQLRDKTGGKRS